MVDYEAELEKLLKASRRLKPDHKQQGRGNSRKAVLAALRHCRAALDETYPVIRKKRKAPISPEARRKELRALGYHRLLLFSAATTRKIEIGDDLRVGLRRLKPRIGHPEVWAPEWFIKAYTRCTTAEIKVLARSPNARAVFMTELRLERLTDGPAPQPTDRD